MGKNMKEASSDDEAEAQSVCVSNYHLEDEDREPVSFAVLPMQWGEAEKSSDATKGQVFLHGFADNGLKMVMMQVTAWRFDLSHAKPEISLLSSKDKMWIKLQKPRNSYQDTIRTILITIHFLHHVKKYPEVSAKSIWVSLFKDKELSSYKFKPSQKDLLDHMPLIGEAAKRVAALSKSKFLLTVVKEKLGNKKLSDEFQEVKDLIRPAFIVDDIDNGMMNEANKESKAEDDSSKSVCAICDDGGDLISCEGPCMRSFHATVEDGSDSMCDSLGFTQKEAEGIENFYCKNCKYNQHQCFACGKLGSSGKVEGAEVIKCASATCDLFYHPHCVAKLPPKVVKHVVKEHERNVADAKSFTCPVHYCCVCKELENMMEPELQFAVCRRCPKSYHRKCLPREIVFSDTDEDIMPRAWDGLLPNNRILIYCLNHEINEEIGTPVRNHIKFPNVKATVPGIKDMNEKMKPATKQRVISNKKNVDLDNSPGKGSARRSKVTGKLSPGKVSSEENSGKIVSGSNTSNKNNVVPDNSSGKSSAQGSKVTGKPSIGKVGSEKNSEKIVSGSNIPNKNNVVLDNSSGKSSAKGSKETGKPSPGKVGSGKNSGKIVSGSYTSNKNNVDLDNASGKCSAKGSKMTGKLSPQKVGSKKNSEKMVSGSNISTKRKANGTSRGCLTENKMSISKKFEVPDSEENKPLRVLMRKGSVQTKRRKVSNAVCKTLSVKPIRQMLPGVDVSDKKIDQQNERPPLLSCPSHSDSTTKHRIIFRGQEDVSSQHQVSKMQSSNIEMLPADHTMNGNCVDNIKLSHDLSKSCDDQEDQASINGGQKSSPSGNVDQESQEGQESKTSESGRTSLKRKRTGENDRRGQGAVSSAKRQAVNESLEGVPGHCQPNSIDGRSSLEGYQTKPAVASPDGPSVEHHSREEEMDLTKSDTRQLDDLDGVHDHDYRLSDFLSGRDHSCVHMVYGCAQPSSVSESSYYKMNAPAIATHLDDTMGSLGSEPPAAFRNGASESRMAQCGYVGSSMGFAPGPHRLAYSPQNSAGWINE